MTSTRAAIYARVSTFEQKTDLQLRDLRDYCERRGWITSEYVDTGVSGAKSSREQLDRMMSQASLAKLTCFAASVWLTSSSSESALCPVDGQCDGRGPISM